MQAALQLRGALLAGRLRASASRRLSRHQAIQIRCAGRETIKTNKAPAPLGAYSQGSKANKLLFVGGQIGIDPETNKFVSDNAAEQAERAMKSMGAILEAAGTSFDNVVKTSLLLADMEDFKEVNAVYAKYFTGDPPARVAYAVKTLPLNAKVEIDAIAVTD